MRPALGRRLREIAVDSYGPVTDNAQSVYELSTIETRQAITGLVYNLG